jgi:hypothetical protein
MTVMAKSLVNGLLQLADLDAERFKLLEEALSKSGPTLSTDEMCRYLEQNVGLQKDDVSSILIALQAFTSAMQVHNLPMEQILQDARQFLVGYEGSKVEHTLHRLRSLLEHPGGLSIAAKAVGVLTDHHNTFRTARILTDIRPIFGPAIEEIKMAGTTMVHTLKIEYSQERARKHFYVALDTSDLKALKKIIERAEEKERVLEEAMKSLPVPYLKVE